MTPQLKYGLIALFILLDVCVVVYFFTGMFSAPVKQAAVQQTTSPPPAAQPPPKTVSSAPATQPQSQAAVQQPPVQPPAPTPQQLQQQREKAAKQGCDRTEAQYYLMLVTDGESKRQDISRRYNTPGTSPDTKRSLENELGNLIQSIRASRSQWRQEKNRCLGITGWLPRWFVGNTDEHIFFRTDCQTRSENYRHFFTKMIGWTESQKNTYLVSIGENAYQEFIYGWKRLEELCARDVPNWVTPASTRTAYERQANTTR